MATKSKLEYGTVITVRTLANLAALYIRFSRIYVTPENVSQAKATAQGYIHSAKIVAEHAKIG